MDFLRDATVSIANILFAGYTDRQKRDNVRFIHGMIVFLLGMFFLFSPGRSWQRILAFSIYVVFIILYVALGDCWVYHVEKEFFVVEEDGGVLGPLRDLLGFPNDDNTQRIFSSIGYFFVCFIGSCLMIRDSFGVY